MLAGHSMPRLWAPEAPEVEGRRLRANAASEEVRCAVRGIREPNEPGARGREILESCEFFLRPLYRVQDPVWGCGLLGKIPGISESGASKDTQKFIDALKKSSSFNKARGRGQEQRGIPGILPCCWLFQLWLVCVFAVPLGAKQALILMYEAWA